MTSEANPESYFIVGMPRSGTTWLSKVLNGHPEVAVFGESTFWGRGYLEPIQGGKYNAKQVQEMLTYLQGRSSWDLMKGDPGCLRRITRDHWSELLKNLSETIAEPISPASLFQYVCQLVSKIEGKPRVVEKTPHHLMWMNRIVAALPQARFVVLVRNPYDWMLSYKHIGNIKPARIRKNFRRRYHPLMCAQIWRSYASAASTAKERYSDRILFIRTEELSTRPQEVLASVQCFLSVKPLNLANYLSPANSSFPSGNRPSLAVDDIFWMNMVSRKQMDQLGYTVQPTPISILPVIFSLLTLPIWAIHMVIHMNRRVNGSLFRYLGRWLLAEAEISR